MTPYSLANLEQIVCPGSRPFKCLPYGVCCRISEFCHSGLCESCFPRNIPPESLLEWCRHASKTSMRHDSCRLACHDKFSDMLFSGCPNDSKATKGDLEDSKGDPEANRSEVVRPCKCQEPVNESSSSCGVWCPTVIGVISLLILIMFCLSRRMKYRRDIRSVINQVEQVTAKLKREGGSSQGENATSLVQSLQNQLTELSQVLKRRSQARGSTVTLNAMAVLESNHAPMTLSRECKASEKKLMDDFV